MYGDSASIQNQKDILLKYAKENHFLNPVFYVDDGYTGTNFDRPGFRQMFEDMQSGKINTLITKDLSRLGRNQAEVGLFMNVTFPKLDVRYIAIGDNVDTINPNSIDSDYAGLKNWFNEFLPRDTSRKVRAVFRYKGESGETLTTVVPYGYVKDYESNCWVIDEEAAEVVKHIFNLCMEGMGPSQIAIQLHKENILTPTAYKSSKGLPINNPVPEDPCKWSSSSVITILERREYTGCTVAFKTYTKSLWDKKKRYNPIENQVITPGTHEAIISQEVFDKVQIIRTNRHRKTKTGKSHIFSGLIYCYDCGEKLYFCTANNFEKKQDFFECSGKRKKPGSCKTHYIRAEVLEKLVWDHMKTVISYIACHEDYFREYMEEQLKIEGDNKRKLMRKQLNKATKRMEELDKLFTKTYEDNALGKLTDERFVKITMGYDNEQKQLEEEILQLENDIRLQEENSNNIDKFVELIKSHFEDNGLNNYNAHEIIKAIYIENCDEEITDANSIEEETDDDFESIVFNITSRNTPKNTRRVRKIHIKYDFVGFIPINELMNKKGDSE